MKKNILILFQFIVFVLLISCASMPAFEDAVKLPKPTALDVKPDKGLIYFVRETFAPGYGATYYIFDGNRNIGASWEGCYFFYYSSPGEHTFWAATESKRYITLNIEAGKTYYIVTGGELGVLVGVPIFMRVTAELAVPMIEQLNYCVPPMLIQKGN